MRLSGGVFDREQNSNLNSSSPCVAHAMASLQIIPAGVDLMGICSDLEKSTFSTKHEN